MWKVCRRGEKRLLNQSRLSRAPPRPPPRWRTVEPRLDRPFDREIDEGFDGDSGRVGGVGADQVPLRPGRPLREQAGRRDRALDPGEQEVEPTPERVPQAPEVGLLEQVVVGRVEPLHRLVVEAGERRKLRELGVDHRHQPGPTRCVDLTTEVPPVQGPNALVAQGQIDRDRLAAGEDRVAEMSPMGGRSARLDGAQARGQRGVAEDRVEAGERRDHALRPPRGRDLRQAIAMNGSPAVQPHATGPG